MKIIYKAFILPHNGEPYRLCADRFAINEENVAFAISDGVGNSLFPDYWAELLCEDFVKMPKDFIENSEIKRKTELIRLWEDEKNKRVSKLTENAKFIYEISLERADFGAATFVGVNFFEQSWFSWSLGDSYLFILDSNFNIIDKVSTMCDRPFDNYPEYFGSKSGVINGKPVFKKGDINKAKYFLLMTDALSDWFIGENATVEQKKKLLNIETHEDFKLFIDKIREDGALKDDDTTVLIITLEQDDSSENFIFFEKGNIDDINELIKEEVIPIKNPSKDDEIIKSTPNGEGSSGSNHEIKELMEKNDSEKETDSIKNLKKKLSNLEESNKELKEINDKLKKENDKLIKENEELKKK